MKPTRRTVLFVYPTLAVGGAERQLALLVPHLAARGFRPVVATLRDTGRHFVELETSGHRVRHTAMSWRGDPVGAARTYRLWKDVHPDVVVTRSVNAQVLGHLIAARADVPHVTLEHGGAGIARSPHRALLTRLLAPHVDRVVVVSRSQVPDILQLGFDAASVRLIPNAPPEVAPRRSRTDVRRELGMDDDAFVAILVATLRPEKRPTEFVEAVVDAHRVDRAVRGLVAGGGPLLGVARDHAVRTGGAVVVLGERSDVPDLLAAADVVCLSSDVEALPMSILEGMALGLPVVATDVGGLRELVVPGETGLLVEVGSPNVFATALLELASDRGRAARMGAAGERLFGQRFTVDRMVEGYVELLSEVLASRSRSGR